jgi:hypothetical protein
LPLAKSRRLIERAKTSLALIWSMPVDVSPSCRRSAALSRCRLAKLNGSAGEAASAGMYARAQTVKTIKARVRESLLRALLAGF